VKHIGKVSKSKIKKHNTQDFNFHNVRSKILKVFHFMSSDPVQYINYNKDLLTATEIIF
jgi:hypothetical protein